MFTCPWAYLGGAGGRGELRPPNWPPTKNWTHKNATCRSMLPQYRRICNWTAMGECKWQNCWPKLSILPRGTLLWRHLADKKNCGPPQWKIINTPMRLSITVLRPTAEFEMPRYMVIRSDTTLKSITWVLHKSLPFYYTFSVWYRIAGARCWIINETMSV